MNIRQDRASRYRYRLRLSERRPQSSARRDLPGTDLPLMPEPKRAGPWRHHAQHAHRRRAARPQHLSSCGKIQFPERLLLATGDNSRASVQGTASNCLGVYCGRREVTGRTERVIRPMVRARRLAKFLFVKHIRGFTAPTDQPHLDAATLDLLRRKLRESRCYLEFGSGGSTVLADRIGVRTISVESDRQYAKVVRGTLSRHGSVEMLTPNIGITGEWGMPLFKNHRKWRRYVDAPFAKLADAFPDLVLIDGRFRVACALNTARHAHQLGVQATLIFDDYEERPFYNVVEQFIGVPQLVGRSAVFHLGRTAIDPNLIDRFIEDPR